MPCEICGCKDAELLTDPFLREVWDEISQRWLCWPCYETRSDDI